MGPKATGEMFEVKGEEDWSADHIQLFHFHQCGDQQIVEMNVHFDMRLDLAPDF